MRHKIEFLGIRFEVTAETFEAASAKRIFPAVAFILLVLGLIFLFKTLPSLILPALSVLVAIKLVSLLKTLKVTKLNDFDTTSRPYVSEVKSEESVPIIELDKLRKEQPK